MKPWTSNHGNIAYTGGTPSHSALDNVSIVLVEPSSPGNVGSVARVLKNTGIGSLRLVNPGEWDVPEARLMAHGAGDILDRATEFPDLAAATHESNLVIGTTHRDGRMREVNDSYRQTIATAFEHARSHSLSIVFGRERDGLWTDEIERCHWLIRIPSAVSHPSFNLSHAVLLIAYEVFYLSKITPTATGEGLAPVADLATADQAEHVVKNILDAMAIIEFKAYNKDPGSFARVLRRFLTRTPLHRRDAMVLHRVCSQIKKFARRHG